MTQNNEINHLINQAKAQAHRERFFNFFGKHKLKAKKLAIVALSVCIGFAVFSFYSNYQQEKFSEILQQTLLDQQLGDVEKVKGGLKKIYEAKTAPSDIKSLAGLRYAAILLSEDKRAEAEKIYLQINECSFCNSYVKDLAGLMAVNLWLSNGAEIAKDDLSSRIEKIEKSAKILRFQIAKQRAFLELQRNNLEKSYQIFESISKAENALPVLKEEAAAGMQIVVAKGFAPKNEDKSQAK